MRILYINHYAGSPHHGMEYRPHYLARQWVECGHEVTIVAASASHIRNKEPELSADIKIEMINGIRYIWLKTPRYRKNGVRRVANMASFVWQLYRIRRMLAERYTPEVVIASSTYTWDIFPARSIALRTGARLVYEVHDLWPLTPMELGGMPRWHPFIIALQWGENYACRHADLVVSMLPFADLHLCEHGMRREKFHYIPNGIDFHEWDMPGQALPETHMKLLEECRREGQFVIGYAGTHGLANALDDLLDAANRLSDRRIAFLLVGQGPEKDWLQSKCRRMGLHNVHFLDPIPKRAIPELLRRTDALFIGWKSQPLYRFGISPNKLLDYMAAGKPIINAVDAPNDWVSTAGCGISVKPENVSALTAAVTSLMALTSSERSEMGMRGVTYVRRHHDYRSLAQQFLSLLHNKEARNA